MRWFIQLLTKLYNRYKLYRTERSFNKALEEELEWHTRPRDFEDINFVEDSVQHKYQEALIILKKRVNSLVEAKTKEDYDRVLKSINDLIFLTKNESHSKHLEVLKNLYVYKEADIKTEEDKREMIQKRIGNYYDLHDNKIKREMSRKIRKLEQEGKVEEAKELLKEWKKRYL